MADIFVDKNATNLDISDKFQGYSRVVIKTGETDENGNDIAYIAGDTTGRTLEIENPWGNQAVADNILAKIQGWAYQPMQSEGASVNPAFEVGDSVSINNIYSGIYDSKVNFSRLFLADIAAPADKEIDHEYQYESNELRVFTRKINDAVARMNFYADKIEAKVDKQSGGTTFGWSLDEDSWDVFNNNGTIFSINSGGAYVKGEIQAGTGKIGNFNIGANGLWNNQSSFGGQEETGVYIGTDGIQLGTKFRVDNQGNLYAANGTFDGNIYAKNIRYGGDFGTLSGGAITPWSIDTGQFVQSVRDSLGFANFSNAVFNKINNATADYVTAKNITGWTYWVGDELADGLIGTVNQHTHFIEDLGNGEYAIGAPDFGGGKHPFSVAPPVTNVTISLNGGASYQTSMNRYSVPIRATDQNGSVIGTGTVYVGASAAYNKGYNDGQNESVTEIYITMISGNSVGVRAYHGDGSYAFRWLDPGDYWNGW